MDSPPPPGLEGRLVLSEYPRVVDKAWLVGNSYLLDLGTGERIPLGKSRDETVSPDGRRVAFYDDGQEKVIVADYEGNPVWELPSPKRKLEPAYWLDDQRLILNDKLSQDPQYESKYGYADRMILVNPFTNDQQEWWPDFPNQAQYFYLWPVDSGLMFNPALTHVVYPYNLVGKSPIVLWDVLNQEEIATLYTTAPPVWSPDGRQFVIRAAPVLKAYTPPVVNFDDGLPYENGSDLFLMNLQGELRRLTYFSIVPAQETTEQEYTWSPSGRQIAFWMLERLHSHAPAPMVVDVENKALVSFCETENLPEDQFASLIFPPSPVWSPDEQYLVITLLNQDFKRKVLLVELSSGKAWQIAENVSAMGWMRNDEP